MSRGKYSPSLPKHTDFSFNCYGQPAVEWNKDSTGEYDEKTMFGNYDHEGFDSYGYPCFDAEGNYVGIGDGVDRLGYTEMDYLCMSDEDFLSI